MRRKTISLSYEQHPDQRCIKIQRVDGLNRSKEREEPAEDLSPGPSCCEVRVQTTSHCFVH